MILGALFGSLVKFGLTSGAAGAHFVNNVLQVGGKTFISLMQMLVVPIIFVSIVSGVCSLEKADTISSIGFKSFSWFLSTTLLASLLALIIASIFHLGSGVHLAEIVSDNVVPKAAPSLWQFISDILPSNPIKAMTEANILQVIMFSLLLGVTINVSGDSGRKIAAFFADLNVVLMKYIMILMQVVPYGVFCLLAILFIEQGLALILGMLNYFIVVLLVLFLHLLGTFSAILRLSGLSPKVFFKKMYAAILFSFGVSSSNASIPIVLDTIENKLGVNKAIASFVIPLGININKNGTAIMQCVATIFIANIYNIQIGLVNYFVLLFMVIMVSVGTAGAPGIGLITLVMILKQLGLPIEGISLIVGVDRLLDMVRTVVNVTGNSMIACLIAKTEKQLDYGVYYRDDSSKTDNMI